MEEVQQCVKELLPRLENNEPGLTEVSLRGKSLGDADAKALGLALRSNTTVTELDLYGNRIGDQGAKDLADGVRHSTTMTALGLDYNQIGAELLQSIEALVATPGMRCGDVLLTCVCVVPCSCALVSDVLCVALQVRRE
jgi:hypothetical protein